MPEATETFEQLDFSVQGGGFLWVIVRMTPAEKWEATEMYLEMPIAMGDLAHGAMITDLTKYVPWVNMGIPPMQNVHKAIKDRIKESKKWTSEILSRVTKG